MKNLLMTLVLFALLSSSNYAQDKSIEKNFGKTKQSLSVVRFAVGEDASSGFDYVVYRKKKMMKNGASS